MQAILAAILLVQGHGNIKADTGWVKFCLVLANPMVVKLLAKLIKLLLDEL